MIGLERLRVYLSFLEALIWPLLVFLIILYLFEFLGYKSEIRKFLDGLGELKVSAGGVDLTAKKLEVTALLGAAEARTSIQPGGKDFSINHSRRIAENVDDLITEEALIQTSVLNMLWVDDEPQNISYLADVFEVLGSSVTIVESTEKALEKLERDRYDIVLSDMGRPPDPKAGYTLLEEMKERGYNIPFIVVATGGSRLRNKRKAKRKGAFGSTDNARELFTLVMEFILSQEGSSP